MIISPTLKQLRAFVAIAEAGSFRIAAKRLEVSQPALSVSIRQLEEILGISLFDRTTRQLSLTPTGSEFFPMVGRLLKDVDVILEDIRKTAIRKRGRVIVACLPSIGFRFMPEILKQFHLRHPGITVQIQDDATADMMPRVARSQVDFGIGSQWSVDVELEFTPVLNDIYVAIFPATSPFARKNVLRWKEIIDQPRLAMAQGTHTRELMDAALAQKRLTMAPFYVASQIQTIIGLVEEGMGIAALPKNALPSRLPNQLRTCRLIDPTISRAIGFITSRRRSLSPAAMSFMSVCREVLERAAEEDTARKTSRP